MIDSLSLFSPYLINLPLLSLSQSLHVSPLLWLVFVLLDSQFAINVLNVILECYLSYCPSVLAIIYCACFPLCLIAIKLWSYLIVLLKILVYCISFLWCQKGELKLISGRLVCEGEYSQREKFFSGGWTSNSGGTIYEAGVVPEYCLSSSKRGEMLFVVLMTWQTRGPCKGTRFSTWVLMM